LNDYDRKVDFSKYKTFAYYKTGIDKADISDLDKKRILRSIDDVMIYKGLIKNESPDLLVSFFTKAEEQINVNQFNMGWGWGWSPFGFGMNTNVSSNTQGILFIDLIDANTKELIWQGEGTGVLTQNPEKKDARIQEFVSKILAQYPPNLEKK
jgi:hypothetical protein